MALLSFCFISLMAGYAIKRLNRTRRCQVMNYTHGVVGLVSLWLAITIIYRTTRLDGGLPCGASGLVVTWMVFYIILHIFMSYMVCYVDFVQGERVSRAYNIFLLRTAPHPPYEDVTGSPIRKCFLCIYVSIFSLITFIIILMHAIWDSCVDETVD
ncbi:unnamed protein product [Allacma fusca]|uniref:Uncharacterized protein n=1 Tax=Allacma fusca TaxID=39272 RepID=A0A8J2NUM3_9HEXA|nr:unnamed protein product [Allacma fusca]